jgi:hypothetical protein
VLCESFIVLGHKLTVALEKIKLDFYASVGEFLESGPARSIVFPLIVTGVVIEKLLG